MNNVNPSDIFEIRKQSLFSERDRDYLGDLYLPIIGAKAYAIFLSLLSLKDGEANSHSTFFQKNQISAGEFIPAMNVLEAMGLVKTFFQKSDVANIYVYCLYAPRDPKGFFDNPLFAGTLKKYLKEEEVNRLAEQYRFPELPEAPFEDISESFTDYFHPDLSDPIYAQIMSGGRQIGKVRTGFDKNAFLKALKENHPYVNSKTFSKEEMVRVARLAALYDYTEADMASFVLESMDIERPWGKRIDLEAVEKIAADSIRFQAAKQTKVAESGVDEETLMGKMIRKMEEMTPTQFLTYLQQGHKPASSDLKILKNLTVDIGLSNPACNALVFYLLTRYDNILSGPLAEKLGASLVRAQVQTAIDTLNYFQNRGEGKEKKERPAPKKQAEKPAKEESKANEADDAEFDALMKELYGD